MTIELSPQEKIVIVDQHLKNVLYSEYNAQISLIEAQSVSAPNQASVDNINSQIKDISLQAAALQKEIDLLNSLISQTSVANSTK
jgi:hypothetical protein